MVEPGKRERRRADDVKGKGLGGATKGIAVVEGKEGRKGRKKR